MNKAAMLCWRCEERVPQRIEGRVSGLCSKCTRSEADRAQAQALYRKEELERERWYAECKELCASFAEQEKTALHFSENSGQDVPTISKVAIILDTPNLTRTIQAVFGPAAAPDYSEIKKIAEDHGEIVEAIAGVNDGIPEFWLRHLRSHGYTVGFSHARDCDDHVVAQIVRVGVTADVVVIGSGDGRFTAITSILRAVGKSVIVIAVRSATHNNLLQAADLFLDVPVRLKSSSGPASVWVNRPVRAGQGCH